ncbi:MAG: hypothetical protein K5685_13085 [Bacteroidales bacterium]|nr:hypothetical protein [Bacteroidales bacterium]
MKKISLLALCSFLVATSCNSTTNDNKQAASDSIVEVQTRSVIAAPPPPVIKETEFFYNFDSASAMIISDPITYEVVVKNHKIDDDWEEERLAKTDIKPLANAIFQAVYKGRLKAYDYFEETREMPISEIKALEKEFNRKDIGNIMFEEKWYFNEKTMTLTKKVTGLTFGYELRDPQTKDFQGFKAAFKVKL